MSGPVCEDCGGALNEGTWCAACLFALAQRGSSENDGCDPVAAAPLENGAVLAGKYTIEECIGRGGFGDVYRVGVAMAGGGRDSLAAKLVRQNQHAPLSAHDLMAREAMLWVSFPPHPCVLSAASAERNDDGRLFISMSLVRPDAGGAVHVGHWIEQQRSSSELATRWGVQACLGLEHAQRYGMHVHRDIKPSNLLVEDGSVLVSDFGIAVATGAAFDPSGSVRLCGTPGYVAPELLAGTPADERVDIYSLGVVVWQVASGSITSPFVRSEGALSGLEMGEIHRQQMERRYARLPGPLGDVVDRALEPDPGRRWRRVAEFREALEELASKEIPVRARRPIPSAQRLNRSSALLHLGHHQQALDVCDEVLESNPRHMGALNNRGLALLWMGVPDRALDAFDEALAHGVVDDGDQVLVGSKCPSDYVLLNRARALFELGRVHDCVSQCSVFLHRHAYWTQAWELKGLAHLVLRESESALEAYQGALDLDPRSVVATVGKLASLHQLGRRSDGPSLIQASIETGVNAYELGEKLEESQDREGAVVAYRLGAERGDGACGAKLSVLERV